MWQHHSSNQIMFQLEVLKNIRLNGGAPLNGRRVRILMDLDPCVSTLKELHLVMVFCAEVFGLYIWSGCKRAELEVSKYRIEKRTFCSPDFFRLPVL